MSIGRAGPARISQLRRPWMSSYRLREPEKELQIRNKKHRGLPISQINRFDKGCCSQRRI